MDTCPACRHARTASRHPWGWLLRRLGRPVLPSCGTLVSAEDGWGGIDCGCPDPWHGS